MNNQKRKQIPPDLVRRIKQMNILDLCTHYGIEVRKFGKYYRVVDETIARSGANNPSLKIEGNLWCRYSERNHGGGVIEFFSEYIRPELMALSKQERFYKACEELAEWYEGYLPDKADGLSVNRTGANMSMQTDHPTLTPRVPFAPDCNRAIAYLCQTRKIDYKIIKILLDAQLLRQDVRGNACFCRYQSGRLIGIEKHGTYTGNSFRQSEGVKGFIWKVCYDVPEHICVFESGIDLLSFAEIYHEKLHYHMLVSMGGLNNLPLELRQAYPDADIYLCVDNDTAGNDFVNRMCSGNDFRRYQTGHCKDWNDMLKLRKQRK